MQLRQLIDGIRVTSTEGTLDREINALTYDSRRVLPGSVFFAIPGHEADGHDFITLALERGASCIVSERRPLLPAKVTSIVVESAREALAAMSAAFYNHPGSKLQVIGVTGTNGKTTVAFMVRRILEVAGVKTGLLGSIRYEVGDRVFPAHRTTPESVELQQMMASMVRAGCQACVMEVSSHALDQGRVRGIDFDVGIFTNLSHEHLDYHGSVENYYAAKKKLFVALDREGNPGKAVINIDDAHGADLARGLRVDTQVTYGLAASGTLGAKDIQLGPTETTFVVETTRGDVPCRIPLIGRHNVYNALAAFGTGLALGLQPAAIASALSHLEQIPGRLERVVAGQPFSVFVDYAHTDDALRQALTTLRSVTAGHVILVFGCGGSRDPGKRIRMGRVAAELANHTIITSDNPRRESPLAIASQVAEGYKSCRWDGGDVVLDRHAAIERALHMAAPGDVVLIAGKGHETTQELQDTVIPFDDRVHAREILGAMGWNHDETREVHHKLAV